MKSREDPSKVFARAEEPGPNRNASTVCRAAILLIVSFAFGLAAPSRGYAVVRTVCAICCKYTTIAAAIAAARAGDTISILDAVHTESNITVDRNLTIKGQGAAKTAVDGALNGTAMFTVASGVTARFQNLTIRNGAAFLPALGGGINNQGTLTVTNSSFSGNSAFFGGGIANFGTLTVTNSTFSDNGFASGGAGIWNEATMTITDSKFSDNRAHAGSGIENLGTLTVIDSTFSDNLATDGGGISSEQGGRLTVIKSTFSGNSAFVGGGILSGETLTVIDSTFSDNSAEFGGGGIESDSGIMTVINSTFLDNGPFLGGGILSLGSATVKNTILAGGGAAENCFGVITDAGYNISNDATCGFSATGSRNSTNPMLDPAGLQNNGGPTATIALDSESPAIDAIPLADCTDLNSNPIHTDQRGALRPDAGEVKVICDIGAYEFQEFAGQSNCERKSDSALVQQYGSLSAAATAYGFSTVKALKAAVRRSCGEQVIGVRTKP